MDPTARRVPTRSDDSANAAMARHAHGEPGAFAEVYDAVAPRLFAYLMRLTSDSELSEELLQETFSRMHDARANFIPGAPVVPWALCIARRLWLDERRRQTRRPTMIFGRVLPDVGTPGWTSADRLLEADEAARCLQEAIAALPRSQRLALELVKRDGLSLQETADRLDATEGSVKARLHRAYSKLREAYAKLQTSRSEPS